MRLSYPSHTVNSSIILGDIREQHPQVPWSQIIGMRNILTHNYFEIDLEIVWSVVERDLPNLKYQIEIILQALS
ncbi:HepT-like ribonuclease domain-containing protein [Scytonema sp. UIC 10036]|uniref:HepT-like ribonuclease domain-containing protein n=1 Tax=Scytonema sp. UIC 10036 TaxID=2304196 RepID=UPI001FAACA1A|nr:HepT-like ribonuclease domain-containing protein [Scytonema sp. UIC 10036]